VESSDEEDFRATHVYCSADFARISFVSQGPVYQHDLQRSFEQELSNPSSPQFHFYSNLAEPSPSFDRLVHISHFYNEFEQQSQYQARAAHEAAIALLRYIPTLEWAKCLQCFSTIFAAIVNKAPAVVRLQGDDSFRNYVATAIKAIEKWIALEFICLRRSRRPQWQPEALLSRAFRLILAINAHEGELQANMIPQMMMPDDDIQNRAMNLLSSRNLYVASRPAAS